MSNIGQMIDSLDDNQAYYNPDSDTSGEKKAVVNEGTYEAVVSKMSIKRDIVVKNKYLSDIFEAHYTLEDDRYPELKGREVKSKGYFRFKNPNKDKYPNLEDNQGNNKGYMIFAEACGFKMQKDDQGRYSLPMITEGDINGNSVTIKIVHDKWTDSSGEERQTPLAINVFKSDRPAKPQPSKEELPF
tara:strand:+ start:190 stop:750 length:561 start_codon:yes stop_codon:yes gene_type:complete